MRKEHLRTNDQLKDIAPKLFEAGKNNPFEVPEGYFDRLPSIIQSKCADAADKAVVHDFRHYFWRISIPAGIAAMFLFLFILRYNKPHAFTGKIAQQSFQITSPALEEEVLGEMDEMFLMETVSEHVSGLEDDVYAESNEIIEYLIDQDIDESAIANQL